MKKELFFLEKDATCDSCENKGAIQFAFAEKDGKLFPAVGFGGTIPFRCTDCGNHGLINIGGLEGYRKAFSSPHNREDIYSLYEIDEYKKCTICNHSGFAKNIGVLNEKRSGIIIHDKNNNWFCINCECGK